MINAALAPNFFVTGGTIPRNAPSYIQRQADEDLLTGLRQGHFCYVLNSRQMGKSSLMVRAATRLREEGVAVAVLDLTAAGQNLSAQQWYEGLINLLARSLDLEDELEEFWIARQRLSPLQKWMQALRDVVLTAIPGRVVIFIDEIDAVRSLPFSADEFFAAIRECYNRRTEDPEYDRLTFCLLGVAAPTDLIQDTRTTPFNIGRRIELTDFSQKEAAPLAMGFLHDETREAVKKSKEMLDRVLYWTGGHPYLTQRLCRAVLEAQKPSDPTSQRPDFVDRICNELFLTHAARERDDNLAFVRNYMLKRDTDVVALLDLYQKVRDGKRVRDDETNPLCSLLRLSGIAREQGGLLKVRNRIYYQAFDKEWVTTHMPDAELHRQREAYRKGITRAVAVSSIIVLAMAALAITATQFYLQADRDRFNTKQAQSRERRTLNRIESLLYGSDMNVAQRTWERGGLERVRELLDRNRPDAQRPEDIKVAGRSAEGMRDDRRGFEWRYLHRLSKGDATESFAVNSRVVRNLAFSPDCRLLVFADAENRITLWDVKRQKAVATVAPSARVISAIVLPRGDALVTGDTRGDITVWDVASHAVRATFANPGDAVSTLCLSSDGAQLASGHWSGLTKLWDLSRGRAAAFKGHLQPVNAAAFTPNGKTLVTAGEDATICLWDVTSHQVRTLKASAEVRSVAVSPGGDLLATGGVNGTIEVWSLVNRTKLMTLSGHDSIVSCLAFRSDSRELVSGGWDYTVRLWSITEQKCLRTLRGHIREVHLVAVLPKKDAFVSGGGDRTVKLWSGERATDSIAMADHQGKVWAISFAPDSKILASGGEDRAVKLWDVDSHKILATLPVQEQITALAFSPSGKTLASGGNQGGVIVWDAPSYHKRYEFAFPGDAATSVAYASDSKIVAVGFASGMVRGWYTDGGKEAFHFLAHRGSVGGLVFFPGTGRTSTYHHTLFTCGEDGMAKSWKDLETSPTVRDPISIPSPRKIAISPDGDALAVSSADGFVNLYFLFSGSPSIPQVLRIPTPYAVTFSQDSKTLSVSSFDKTIRLWSVPSYDEWYQQWQLMAEAQEMLALKGHLGPVLSLAFSPDRNLLVSAGWKSDPIRLWRASTEEESNTKQQ